jgi:membrane-bound lytic murein transglycosylase D
MRAGEPVLGVPVPAEAPAAETMAPGYQDLWSRIRAGFKMPDLTNKRAQQSTRWYAGRPDYIARMTARANLYLYHIVDEIEKRGMPTELALLPFVESAMQPEAVSWAHAAGLWQFIPATGKVYSLEQSLWKDERFGVIESTRAALDYLQKLHDEFGDWQLALAAYNYGEAGVERALARARAARKSTAYADLRLPTETQFYVPKLQALKNIIADPARYGIELPQIANQPYFVAFNKLLDIDVATAAKLADMSIEDFRALNPAFNRPVILGASSPTLLVPADRADTFEANLAAWQATGQPLASWTAYTLQSGETVARVAERVGLTEAQLRVANHIPPRYRPASGSTLLIPRDENMGGDIAPDFVQASFSLVPDGNNLRQVTYRVRRGDTLATVARRWNVSAEDIASWNNLNGMTLFTGQRLNLTVASRPAAPAVRHAVATKKKSAKPAVQPAVATGSGIAPAASSPNTSRM